jgi:hypothetical protein
MTNLMLMKKNTLYTLLAILILSTPLVQAQQRRPGTTYPRKDNRSSRTSRFSDDEEIFRHNILKINFISPLAATISGFYERVITERMSAQLGVQYTGYSGFITDNEKLRGFAITPEFRYYVTQATPAPNGIYVAPFLRYRNTSLAGDIEYQDRKLDGKIEIRSIGGGMLVGGQYLIGDRVSIEGYIGPTISGQTFKATEGSTKKDYSIPNFFSPVWFRSGFTVGIAF